MYKIHACKEYLNMLKENYQNIGNVYLKKEKGCLIFKTKEREYFSEYKISCYVTESKEHAIFLSLRNFSNYF